MAMQLRGWLPRVERQVSSLFKMRVGERAWPLAEAGAVVMALPLVGAGTMQVLSGDDLFSAPKTSWSLSNSDLRHLWHSSDSECLRVPETLWSTSYSEPLPAVPNATACSFHSDPSPNTPSNGWSETSASSKGNLETPPVSTPSDPNSAPTLFGDSLSHNGVRVTPVASDIKG